jgi:flagellar motor switch protein FliM
MVELRAGEIPLFKGRMGQRNDRIAVQIEASQIIKQPKAEDA